MRRLALADDGYCFACGRENPSGLGVVFREEGGKVVASFTACREHQGFKGIVHGGIITTVLDEAMIKAVLLRGIGAVTAEIKVRFKRPLYVGDPSTIEAGISEMGNRLIHTTARIMGPDGSVVAEAAAKLLRNG